MNKKCARCEKTVYPIEELKCLDKAWHKSCFKCQECGMTLSMKTYKGFNKLPYCEAHIPKAKATTVAETPEMKRLAENTKNQSNVQYHAEFEKSKARFTQIADDPETRRIQQNSKIISNASYHGDLEKKAWMESKRGDQDNPNNTTNEKDVPAPKYEGHQYHHQPERNSHQSTSIQHTQAQHASFNQQNRSKPHYNSNAHAGSDPSRANYTSSTEQYQPHYPMYTPAPVQQQPPVQNYAYDHSTQQHHQQQQPNYAYQQNAYYDNNHNSSYSARHGVQTQNNSNHATHHYDPATEHYAYNQQKQQTNQSKKVRQPGAEHHQMTGNSLNYPVERQNYGNMQHPQAHMKVNAPPTQLGRCFRALYDYEAADSDEVSFRDGDLLVNCTSIDKGWMLGTVQRTGKTGMLPANYVERAA